MTEQAVPGIAQDVFLLNQRNHDFLTGKASKPAGLGGRIFGCGFLFIGLFCLVGIGLLMAAFMEQDRFSQLAQRGVVTTGEYYDKYTEYDGDGGDTYHVQYQFIVPETGRTFNRSQSVSRSTYDRIERGQRVSILYDPLNPANSRIDGTNTADTHTFLFVFSTIWNLISWSLLIAMIYSRRHELLLIRRGQVIPGKVNTISGELDNDDNFILDMRYVVRTPDGIIIEKQVKGTHNQLRDADLPAPGRSVAVLYVNPDIMRLL